MDYANSIEYDDIFPYALALCNNIAFNKERVSKPWMDGCVVSSSFDYGNYCMLPCNIHIQITLVNKSKKL